MEHREFLVHNLNMVCKNNNQTVFGCGDHPLNNLDLGTDQSLKQEFHSLPKKGKKQGFPSLEHKSSSYPKNRRKMWRDSN